MNKIYNKNISTLKKHWPYIDIKSLKKSTEMNYRISLETCKDMNKTAKIYYNSKNLYLNSKYDPIKEAKKFADNIIIEATTTIILFGFGFGYHVKAVLDKLGDKNHLIVIEPDFHIFNAALHNVDLSNIISGKNIYVCIGKSSNELRLLFKSYFKIENISNTKIVTQIPYVEIFSVYFNMFKEVFDNAAVDIQMDKYTYIKQGLGWTKNSIAILNYFFESLSLNDFACKFSDIPAIIVSAGPSLNKNIHLLKQMKNKALIISTYSALKVVLKNDVIPDFIIALDPNQLMLESVEEKKQSIDIPLIYLSTTSGELLNKHKGKKVYLSTSIGGYNNYLLDKFRISYKFCALGGSVASTATDFAYELDCNPIIFIGQDYAFTDDRHHVSGINHDCIKYEREDKHFLIDSVLGDKVYTDIVLDGYRQWLENYIYDDNSNREYIDATEGGALIKGTKISTFQEVIDKYSNKDINVEKILDEIFNSKTPYTYDHKEFLYKDLNKCYTVINDLISKLDESQKYLNELIDSRPVFDALEMQEIKYKIQLFNEEINSIDKNTNLFFNHTFLSALYQAQEFTKNSVLLNMDKNMRFCMENCYYYDKLKFLLSSVILDLKSLIDHYKRV